MLQRFFIVLIALAVSAGAWAENPTTPANCPASSASTAAVPVGKFKMAPVPVLKPTAAQGQTAILVARLLTRFEYEKLPLDSAMSKKIFKAYFKALDSNKLFFTQQDIDRFAPDRTKLDTAIWNGNLTIPFQIFNLYEKRAGQRTAYALALLKKGFDLDTDATYTLDREKAPWAANTEALDKIWQKRVENDWISLKLAGRDSASIRKLLSQRYENYLNRLHQLDSEDVFQTFLNSYATATDPHTNYFGPRASQNFAIEMNLSLDGIGAVLQQHGDYTVIRQVVAGGPAAKSGKFEVGDKIVGVGQGRCGPIADVVGWRIDDVVSKIRGKKGTTVRIEILPAEGGPAAKPRTITLVRQKVTVADSVAKKKVLDINDGGRTIKIGVIDLPSFYENFSERSHGDKDYRSASRDVAKLLRELEKEKVSAVIVDLRDNGGGSLDEAINLSGLFIGKGPVVQVRDNRGQVQEDDSSKKMLWTGPMAVLVNRGSASASEIFTAAIQDYGRGLIIGEKTWGKGTVQNLTNLDQLAMNSKPTFGELKMTIAEFFRVDGDSTQLHGVTPNIKFPHSVGYKDFGESSYPNALPWSHIPPAEYTPVATQKPLVAPLTTKFEKYTKTDPAWQLLLAELTAAKKLNAQKTVSLNYEKREAERKQQEAQDASFKKRRKALGDLSGISLEPGNGLTPDEQNVRASVAREKAAKNSKDIELDEAGRIMANEVVMLDQDPKLARTVLPRQAFHDGHLLMPPGIRASAAASMRTAAPASAASAR